MAAEYARQLMDKRPKDGVLQISSLSCNRVDEEHPGQENILPVFHVLFAHVKISKEMQVQ